MRLLVAALLAIGEGAALAARTPVRSLLEIRQANVVPQQWDTSCGAAALATVLTYGFGQPVSEREVAQAMLGRIGALRVKVRGGFSLLDLKRFAQSRGFQADGYLNVSLDALEQLGLAIVPVQLEGYPHFVVFRGRSGDRVLLSDPGYGNRSVAVEDFQEAWQKMAFVVQRPGRQPVRGSLGPELQDRLRPTREMIRSAIVR